VERRYISQGLYEYRLMKNGDSAWN
jgi:hypothetical protein